MAKQLGEVEKIMEGAEAAEFVNSDALLRQRREEQSRLDDLLGDKNMLKTLDDVHKAKDEQFKEADSDFWKPTKVGETLKGVYLGSVQGKKYMVHAIGTKDSKGKPLAVRVNGSTILTKEIKREGIPGRGIIIVYEGAGKTEEGQKLNQYKVKWLDNV